MRAFVQIFSLGIYPVNGPAPRRRPQRSSPAFLVGACIILAALAWGVHRGHQKDLGRIIAEQLEARP